MAQGLSSNSRTSTSCKTAKPFMSFRPNTCVSLRLRVQNAVPAQPCVRKLGISLVLLNFLHCNFYRPQTKFAKVMFLQVSVCPRGGACMSHDQPVYPPGNHACPPATTHTPPAATHAPQQPCTPPGSHACPPSSHAHTPATMHTPLLATMHATPWQPCMPPGNHACPLATTHAPPSGNHAHLPGQPCTPPWQPCMHPPSSHTRPPGSHACPPQQPCMPPWQPCTPPQIQEIYIFTAETHFLHLFLIFI